MPHYAKSKRRDLLVASDLQRGLVETIGDILSDVTTVDASGDKTSGFKGYAQRLPVQVDADDDPDKYFPYFIVRLLEAKTTDDNDFWTWRVAVYLGVHDDGLDNEGHFSLLNAMTRITSRFGQEATFGCSGHIGFRVLDEMEMELQDEDTYPYFLGAVLLKVAAPKITREDPF